MRPRREAGQEASVLERVGEVAGNEDANLALGRLGETDGLDGRQLELLEVAEDVELAAGDAEGLFLQGEEGVVDDEEADEVARRANGDGPEGEALARPGGEGALPRQLEEGRRRGPQPQVRKLPRRGRWAGLLRRQIRFRKYAVAVGS